MALASILQDWPQWPMFEQPQIVKTFDAGLNHAVALLQGNDGRQIVLKQFLGDGEWEIKVQQWAASRGLAPQVLFAPENYRYLLMEVMDGQTLAERAVQDADIENLAKALQKLHSSSASLIKEAGFDIVRFCDGYVARAGKKAESLHATLLPILREFSEDDSPPCFCHNDLVTTNIFVNNGAATFIDWEFAGWNNPWFDLAALIYYLGLNKRRARDLLSAYAEGWQSKSTERIFYTAQISLLWADMSWHLAKYGEEYWPQLSEKESDLQRLAGELGVKLIA